MMETTLLIRFCSDSVQYSLPIVDVAYERRVENNKKQNTDMIAQVFLSIGMKDVPADKLT